MNLKTKRSKICTQNQLKLRKILASISKIYRKNGELKERKDKSNGTNKEDLDNNWKMSFEKKNKNGDPGKGTLKSKNKNRKGKR